jgi:hypothetical protein
MMNATDVSVGTPTGGAAACDVTTTPGRVTSGLLLVGNYGERVCYWNVVDCDIDAFDRN